MYYIMKNKIFVIIITFLLTFGQFNLIASQSINNKTNVELNLLTEIDLEDKNYHIIENFPYVSQESNFYCTYACPTMILKYYGFETNLFEVLFNSGVGYSLIYSHPTLQRFLLSCIATSNWNSDRQFLAEIYGLSYEENRLYDESFNEEVLWKKYWIKIKKNIINQTPVITIADPIYLQSIRNCIKSELNITDDLMEKIPDFLWNFFPCFMNHMIVIIGFNENNNTICFNDPSTEVFGFPEFGKYSWMNLTDFRDAMRSLSYNQPYYSYFVGIFKNISQNPLNKNDRFILSFNRNIERMKGNLSYYDNYIVNIWNCSNLGINSLKEFKKDISNNIYGKILTIFLYKFITTYYLFSISYKVYFLFDKFFPLILNLSDYHSQMNYFYQLAVEKKDISNFLWNLQFMFNDSNISNICYYNSMYLNFESENFSKLASNFSEFLRQGFFIKNSNALDVLNNMEKLTNNLIYLENKIINYKYS
jgi:hypothetical protein